MRIESPFVVKLREIPPEGLRREFDLGGDFGAAALAGTGAEVGPEGVRADVEITRVRHEVYARGRLVGVFTAPCSRCVQPATVLVGADVARTFVPAAPESGRGGEIELDDDELDVETYEGEQVDLESTLREEVLLALPMAPLCREGCKGLCATCGANRNEKDCGHAAQAGERPFAALKDVKL